MEKLNKEQEAAANAVNGIFSLIAVPGSGKTRTMMHRIQRLVESGNPPESIIGLTFTKNAAEEMRNRLMDVLGDKSARVMLSTIHGFCYYILKREGIPFEIISGKQQIIFIRKIMKSLKIKNLSVAVCLREISLSKNNLVSLEEFRDLYEGDKTMLEVADVFKEYEQSKEKKLLMDFDDLIINTVELLKSDESVRFKYQSYKHLLVDEFQDTNPLQLELIKTLLSNEKDTSLWTAGDDWQSIYAFTGASIGNILKFTEIFPGSREFVLNINYRSTPQILKGCQNLIEHNQKKKDKTLKTNNPDGEEIIILECGDEEDEGLRIVNEINDLIERKGYKHKDIAVLYRANFQSRTVEEVFSKHEIPYFIQGGTSFYSRPEVKTLLSYLWLIHSPESEVGDDALLQVINKPNRYIGNKIIKELKDYASENGVYLYEALGSMAIDTPYIKHNIKIMLQMLEPIIADKDEIEPSQLIGLLRTFLDYDTFIADDSVPAPDDEKITNINHLQLSAAKFNDLESFLKHTENFKEETSHDKEGVSLMTVHKAKGLEFPVVFVIGMVEGLMPSKKGEDEEERRICFVAISRAMKLLYLSYSNTYLNVENVKSRFIGEILQP